MTKIVFAGATLMLAWLWTSFLLENTGTSSTVIEQVSAETATLPISGGKHPQTAYTDYQILDAVDHRSGYLDFRAFVLDEYFRTNSSPLYGSGEVFVKACDKFGAPKDCTTVAAIAKAETDLCKYSNSAEYHNCWGFGGGGADRMYFSSWKESVDLVTERLVRTYGLKYMIDPSLMEDVFCGSEPGCTNWGSRVKYFMNEISEFSIALGFPKSLFQLR